MWYEIWLYVYLTWFRRMLKWVLRRATGRCELVRICCSGGANGGAKTKAIENSLRLSRLGTLQRIVVDDELNIQEAINYVIAIKKINIKMHPEFSPTLQASLRQICGYNRLVSDVEAIKKETYSTANQVHEQELLKLWRLLMPNTQLKQRISKQWRDIGFQGDDPSTDFRGMGVLGLHNLVFFAENYSGVARQVLTHSQHPSLWYSFAVVGINLTSMAYHLLRDGSLRDHFYNSVTGQPAIYHFHRVYCYIFTEFDRFWFAEKPKSVMEFGSVRDKFEKKLLTMLRTDDKVLQNNYTSS